MIANQVLKMQEESKTMMTRYVEESKKREEMLKREQVYVLPTSFLKKKLVKSISRNFFVILIS